MKPVPMAARSGVTVTGQCTEKIVADGPSWGVTLQCVAWCDPTVPYRLAIAVSEMFPELAKNGRVRIVTLVADPQIADRTINARFDYLEANRSFATKDLLRYFRQDGTTWVATRQLREMVELRTSSSASVTAATGGAPVVRTRREQCSSAVVSMQSLSREALLQSTESVLARLFGTAVEVRPEPHSFSSAGAVVVIGAHHETVVVRVAKGLLMAYASSLLSVDEADISETDRSDALLELVDVLAGAVRTAIPGDATLTVPYEIAVSLVDRDVATAANVVSFSTAKGLLSILTVCGQVHLAD